MAGLAFVLSVILLAATGTFFVAREAVRASQMWAYQLCGTAAKACENPEWLAFATIFMMLVYFVLRARDA